MQGDLNVKDVITTIIIKLKQEIASLMSNYSKTPLIKLPVLL